MPTVSAAQHRLMEAAAHTPGGYGGVPQSVGQEFVGKDAAPEAVEPAPIDPQAGPSGRAAGIMFMTADGEVLLMHRGDGGDFPRTWGFPGGHLEDGETEEQAARREAEEETGLKFDGELTKLRDDGQFVTYLARGVDKFPVTICDESTGFTWAKPDALPDTLHPGVSEALRIAGADTELAVAELIRDGLLPSPQRMGDMWLFDLRITGTGQAYRSAIEEHVWRDPSLYLNDEFLARCNGLPVIWVHPEKSKLNSDEYRDRSIGSVMLPYIKGDEVWGVSRIYDADAVSAMTTVQLSTSPGVVFGKGAGNAKITLPDGSTMLIEGKPGMVDHLAVCEVGVWDKGGEPAGVNVSNEEVIMADSEGKKEESERFDSAAFMDSMKSIIADSVGELCKRMDSMEKRFDSEKDEKDEKDEKEEKARADAARKDEEDKRAAEEQARKDAAAQEEQNRADAESGAYADAQAKADGVFTLLGKRAPAPMTGESLRSYRTRLASTLKASSTKWKEVDLGAIADSAAFGVVEGEIYADAAAEAGKPAQVQPGQLVESVDTSTGHRISTFRGDPMAWMRPFHRGGHKLVAIKTKFD